MKYKIYRCVFVILSILFIIIIVCIGKKYYVRNINENENSEIIKKFFSENNKENYIKLEEDSKNQNTKIQIHGYDVIGKIKIEKINIEYPIVGIETSNPEETKKPMKFAIVRYWGENVNDYGNLSIAGHNNHDGTLFGKTKNLDINDELELTDLHMQTIKYKIYSKFVTNPNDVSVLKTTDNGIREVTLITCTNGNKERLILKAKEVK